MYNAESLSPLNALIPAKVALVPNEFIASLWCTVICIYTILVETGRRNS